MPLKMCHQIKILPMLVLFVVLLAISASLIKASPVPINTPATTPKAPKMPTTTTTTTPQSPPPPQSPPLLVHIDDDVDDDIQIVKYTNENIGANGYNFAFETSDGVSRREKATVKNVGSISVEGTVSWTGPDGVQYTLNYLADEHGFQPQGTHLPVAPEPAI